MPFLNERPIPGYVPGIGLPSGVQHYFDTPEEEDKFIVEYRNEYPNAVLWRCWKPEEKK